MAVLRYFHLDPRLTTVQESYVKDTRGTDLTSKLATINTSITNNTYAIEDKQDQIPGKSLSTNDFTDYYKNKLISIEEGAEVNVQADWTEEDDTANNVHLIDCLRVNRYDTHINGYVKIGNDNSLTSFIQFIYPGTDSFISGLKFNGESYGAANLYVGQYDHDIVLDGRNIYVKCDEVDVMYITKWDNYVGIGTTSPSYKLHVNGACAASSFPNTSDIRLKDVYSDWSPNIEDIAYAPSFLFKWKDGKDKNMHAGTSAQYWLSKAPELVTEAKDDIGTLSIQYDVLGTLSSITLAKEILELKKEIKRLQALIAEIKLLQK